MVGPLAFRDFRQRGVADVCIDDRDCRTREITESEAEVDNHGRNRDVVTRRDETDDADSFIVDSSRNPRACGFDVTHGGVVELDADRREQRIVAYGGGFGTVWHG